MNKSYIKKNINFISIIIFLLIYSLIIYIKPNFLFINGKFRNFGLGNKNKTILPIWLIIMIICILIYVSVYHYLYIY